jgi:hypothetical protein
MLFCAGSPGKIACCAEGQTRPKKRRTEQKAPDQLAYHRGLADALSHFAD